MLEDDIYDAASLPIIDAFQVMHLCKPRWLFESAPDHTGDLPVKYHPPSTVLHNWS